MAEGHMSNFLTGIAAGVAVGMAGRKNPTIAKYGLVGTIAAIAAADHLKRVQNRIVIRAKGFDDMNRAWAEVTDMVSKGYKLTGHKVINQYTKEWYFDPK